MSNVYAKVKNEFGANILIPACELEDYIENLIEEDEFTIEFVRISDEEFEEFPDFEG